MQENSESNSNCYHCGLKAYPEYSAELEGVQRSFCCIGCQAVAQAIASGGLSSYYSFRDAQAIKPEAAPENFEAYDEPSLQESFVQNLPDGSQKAYLQINGISCAACSWLIENYLQSLVGTISIRVNVSTHRCVIHWNPKASKLSDYFSALSSIGYRPLPAGTTNRVEQDKNDSRKSLLRLGLAGLGMMQVGMVAIALHAGGMQGIEGGTQHFLRWVSLLFASPVIGYSAVPFFISAWRAIKLRSLNMDVPVSFALILAFSASAYSTLTNTGEVYFDSVSMFCFFLLLGRHLEMRARHSQAFEFERLTQLLPHTVEKFSSPENASENGERFIIPLNALTLETLIWVPAGAVFPCDGELQSEFCSVDESVLSGESELQSRSLGDQIYAGSLNGDQGAIVKVKALGVNTRLAAIEHLVDEAALQKPKVQVLADQVSVYFVAAVLLLFFAVYAYWYFADQSQAFWIALSVLVVTCPCALSLATPAALTAGISRLRRSGFLIAKAHVMEALASINHIVFDKTGTLTLGQLRVQDCLLTPAGANANTQASLIEIIAALEAHSKHPVALAFTDYVQAPGLTNIRVVPGQGVEGDIADKHYRFGQKHWASDEAVLEYPGIGLWQLLSCDGKAMCWIRLSDQIRDNVKENLVSLNSLGFRLSLLSGDRQENVDRFVEQELRDIPWQNALGAQLPETKLSVLSELQSKDKVMMLGDGINDLPVISAADVSVAMGNATQLAKTNADCILLNSELKVLPTVFSVAQKVKHIIRQNLAWALLYNLLALPAAAMGFVPPWLAALGMSLSSLVVVLNALRLSR